MSSTFTPVNQHHDNSPVPTNGDDADADAITLVAKRAMENAEYNKARAFIFQWTPVTTEDFFDYSIGDDDWETTVSVTGYVDVPAKADDVLLCQFLSVVSSTDGPDSGYQLALHAHDGAFDDIVPGSAIPFDDGDFGPKIIVCPYVVQNDGTVRISAAVKVPGGDGDANFGTTFQLSVTRIRPEP